jgi:hypothetical protein
MDLELEIDRHRASVKVQLNKVFSEVKTGTTLTEIMIKADHLGPSLFEKCYRGLVRTRHDPTRIRGIAQII